jgi:hypothetical protein
MADFIRRARRLRFAQRPWKLVSPRVVQRSVSPTVRVDAPFALVAR